MQKHVFYMFGVIWCLIVLLFLGGVLAPCPPCLSGEVWGHCPPLSLIFDCGWACSPSVCGVVGCLTVLFWIVCGPCPPFLSGVVGVVWDIALLFCFWGVLPFCLCGGCWALLPFLWWFGALLSFLFVRVLLLSVVGW